MAKTLEAFIAKSQQVHNGEYLYHHINELNGMSAKYPIECQKHGIFLQSASNHQRGNKCPKCQNETKNSERTYTFESWVAKAKKVHGDKYDYDLMRDMQFRVNTKVPIRCSVHGVFYQRATNHISYGTGCTHCNNAKPERALGNAEIISRCHSVHNNRYDYSKATEVTRTLQDMTVICSDHGEFTLQCKLHLAGTPCPECRKILGNNRKQNKWLDSLNVPYDNLHREVRIDLNDGIKKQYLKVDGYDSTTNTVYEFWGDHWHGNPQVYSSDFVNKKNGKTMGQLYRDTIEKRQRILAAGYKLIEIWESEWDAKQK